MPVKKKEITYMIKDKGYDGTILLTKDVDNVIFAYTPGGKNQINGPSPHLLDFIGFWDVPISNYLVTFKLSARGKYVLSSDIDSDGLCGVTRVADGCDSEFTLCIFPKTRKEGDRFNRIVQPIK